MKKIYALLCSLLSCSILLGLPSGNPAEPSLLAHKDIFLLGPWIWSNDDLAVRVGYYGDFVFDRYLEKDSSEHPNLTKTIITTHAGYAALNFNNFCDVFISTGVSNLNLEGGGFAFGDTRFNNIFIVETDTSFSWGGGIRAILYQKNFLTIGFEGQFFRTLPRLNKILELGAGNTDYGEGHRVRYHEWQGSIGVAYAWKTYDPTFSAVPYLSLLFSRGYFDGRSFFLDTGTSEFTLERYNSRKIVGYSVGTSLTFWDFAILTFEGRWGSENAFYVNGSFQF